MERERSDTATETRRHGDETVWMRLDAALERPVIVETPEGDETAFDAPAPFDRRGFLKAAGLAASLAACERLPVRHALPYLIPPEEITPGVSVHYASTCTACPAACGLMVTVRDGRPVKLEGLPSHPLSKGGLCALGQADLRALYDGGRLQAPTLGGKKATWAELDALVGSRLEEVRRAGRAVYVLAPTIVSPTARRAVEEFLAAFKGLLVEHDLDPEAPSALLEAYERLDGHALAPVIDVEKADLLVVLASDLLGTGPDPVAATAAYAARRRASGERGPLRHVQIEGSLSLTGAGADERWQATAEERRLIALWLARHVAEGLGGAQTEAVRASLQSIPPLQALRERTGRLATSLVAHRGRSLVVSAANDPGEQLAVALCNRLLGNEGRTLDLARRSLVRRGLDRDLASLLAALGAGDVGALIVVGLDPVDQLPDGEAFRAALAKLPLAVAVGSRTTATAAACHVVAAGHHGLESWGDAMPRSGLRTVAQPTIRPLFDTRHPFENFLHWSGSAVTDYRLYLRSSWQRVAGGSGDFEAFWDGTLAEGKPFDLADPVPSRPAAKADAGEALRAAVAAGTPAGAETLEAELISEVALRDGSRAHVPWLRELPDPLTRVAWSACARVAPERARVLGVRDGDVVSVEYDGRRVTLPVRIQPGQHPWVVALPVGYGRVDGGGDAARNACRVARWEDGRLRQRGLRVALRPTGAVEALPIAQPQAWTQGRPVVHQVSSPQQRIHSEGAGVRHDLWARKPRTSPQWEMVVDLNSCTGCSACVIACQAENNTPVVGPDEVRRNRDMHWIRIDRYFVGSPDAPDVLFEPMLCAQCGHAPCETVCPVAATVHSSDGLNQQVYNRCVGTRYCANNCPYKVRRFNWFDNEETRPLERMVLNPDVVVRSRGVMEKCTFCVQRIQAARIAARKEGWTNVPEPQTACQQSCPARAISFGDGADVGGELSRLKAAPPAFQILADLGIEPKVTYLARVRSREGVSGGEA